MTRGQVGSPGQMAETAAEVFHGPWTLAVAMAEACDVPWTVTGGAPERIKRRVSMTGEMTGKR